MKLAVPAKAGILALFLTGALCFAGSFARADFPIPEKPAGYVHDEANLFSPGYRVALDNTLRQFEAETSNQIVVAGFMTLSGESLEDTSIKIAQKWKIGQKGRDNGVLLVVFRLDHEMRIEVGYGLEGVLTDALSSQIIRNEITPFFKQGQYEEGISAGVKAIMAATKGEYKPMQSPEEVRMNMLKFFLGIIGFIAAIDLIRYGIYVSQNVNNKNRYGFWEWCLLFAILWLILKAMLASNNRYRGGWSSGSGGGYSGGGFSGGGGSFGGGGASGRW